jgi:hypothetical protein
MWGRSSMNNGFLLFVVLFFVLGSATVSSIESLSYYFKSAFYGLAITVLIIIALINIYNYFKRDRN